MSVTGQIAKLLLTVGAMTEERLNDELAEQTDVVEWIDLGHAKLDYLYENDFATVTDDARLSLTDAGRKHYERTFKI